MGTFTKLYVCLIFVLITIREGKAGLLQTCGNNADCQVVTTGDPNAVCSNDMAAGGDTDGNCICTGAYQNNGNNDGCVAKGNGDPCAADSDCAAVTNSVCESGKTCGCADGYKISATTCSAVLGTACTIGTAATDCTDHVENTACTNDKCSCATGYQQYAAICSAALLIVCADNAACQVTGGDPKAVCSMHTNAGGDADGNCICTGSFKYDNMNDECVAKVLGDTCTADSDCAGVANASCDTSDNQCGCIGAYKSDGSTGCTAKGNGVPCSADPDCAAVTNSACESDNKCGCADGYKISTTTCSAVLGTTCAAGTAADDCTDHVENAACTDDECTCVTGFHKSDAICSPDSSADSARLSGTMVAFSVVTFIIAYVM